MRIIKPLLLSTIHRPFERVHKLHCGISSLTFVQLAGPRAVLSEVNLWPFVADVLGKNSALDEGIPKQRGEFLVAGHAFPNRDPAKCRVRVKLGDLDKTLNVLGNRVFEKDRISQPAPFEAIPLDWEHAFGGEGFKRNPLGIGAAPVTDDYGRKFHPLPNIEYPHDMLGMRGQRTKPAGFGPIDPMWPQRQRKAGTYDKQWLEQHFPAYPPDIDWSFFNLASEDQQSPTPFRGDEAYILEGMHPDRPRIEGHLPGITTRCFIRRRGKQALDELACRLTTVWFFPEHERAVLIHHASAEVSEPDAADITELMIAADDLDNPRPAEHFHAVFEKRMDEEKGVFEMLNDRDLLPEGIETPDALDLNAMLQEEGEGIRAKQMKQRMEEEQNAAREKIEALGQEMEALDVASQTPDLGVDLNDLSSLRVEELPEVIEKLEAYAEKSRAEMEEKQKEAKAEREKMYEEMGQEPPPDPGGPPSFNAAQQEKEIRDNFEQMKAHGMDVREMEEQMLGPDALEMLRFAEEGAIRSYRVGAHYQNSAPAADPGAGLKEKLLGALKVGESLDAKDYTGADLSGSDLSGADLSGIFLESANLAGANLSRAKLDKAVLAHADMCGVNLEEASLKEANLGKSRMNKALAARADFENAVLTEADLSGAVLEGANLHKADIREAILENTRMAGITADHLILMEISVAGLDFSGADLKDAVFIETDLSGADFSGAQLDKAAFLNCTGSGARFVNAALHNLRVVQDCNFTGADFSQATLTEACLRGTRLIGADFSGADLSRSDLSEIQGGRCRFHRAHAVETRFINADLREADLSGANLMGASLERADIRNASLKGANLFGLDLARVHVDRATDFDGALMKRMRTYPRKFPKEVAG